MWTGCNQFFKFVQATTTATKQIMRPLGLATAVRSKLVAVQFSCGFFPPVATGLWNTN